jgi:ParB-like chromosome segregation protein Spo0J
MAVTFPNVLTSRAGLTPTTFPASELSKIRRGWNCRIDLQNIEELAHQIAESPIGQHEAGAVRKGEGGDPFLIKGNRRLSAIQYINDNLEMFQALYPHIKGPLGFKAYTLDVNEDEAIEITLSENLDRMGLSPMDKAHSVRDLENRGWDDKRIARVLRCSTTYLPTLRSYLTLPKEAQDALHHGTVTGDLAKSLVGLPDSEIKAAVKEVKEKTIRPSDAKRKVDSVKRKKGVKVARSYKEIKDELASLEDDYDLAFDLLSYFDGESTHKSLEEIMKVHNKQVHMPEAEVIRAGKAGTGKGSAR